MPCSDDYIFEPFKVIEVKNKGKSLPRPRSGHRIVCDDTYIYCFGGYNPSLPLSRRNMNNPTWTPDRPLFKELWSFCIASRKWKEHRVVENMPEELASNAMCISGRNLMVYGGTGAPFGNKCSNDVILWRVANGDAKFQVLDTTGSRPPGQYGQAIICYDGYLYTIGGTNSFAYNCDIYRLNLQTLEWEPVFVGTGQEGEPLGRYRHELARLRNELYILGGGTGEWAYEVKDVPIFNLDSKSWTIQVTKPDDTLRDNSAPLPRKCHSAVQVNTPTGVQAFIVGGTEGQTVFNDIWRLDIPNMQWRLMRKSVLPYPLYFHSSTVTSYGCMYTFGGIESKEFAASRSNILYKMWLCIPKLSEICWEALLSFYPSLDQVSQENLINIGIPRHFVHRLHGP